MDRTRQYWWSDSYHSHPSHQSRSNVDRQCLRRDMGNHRRWCILATTGGGTDYTATATGTLSWGDGDADPKTIAVNIVNDTLVEGDETVEFSLSNFTGAGIGSLRSTTLTIVDDERLQIPYTNDFNTDNGGFKPVVLSGSGYQWEWGAGQSGKPNMNGSYATIERAANWMTMLNSWHGGYRSYALETPLISLLGGTGDYFLVQLHSLSADSMVTGNIDGLASVASSNNIELSDTLPDVEIIELPEAELGVQLP
ncbi:hypothetical protein THIOM_004019 [Candidatus Thiomargarita nelsonii]|uniref:Calx-beta domain-containing protein n=1 Tax=Candidatus Thiomargarita nelsonii TaxID=1003181 RepID=A0A176RWZ6_9GAMM|nr:hypothetical protein THIOM_004019 [Candidatus Thiomargarita nelsonii]